jgi:hypothetical protein
MPSLWRLAKGEQMAEERCKRCGRIRDYDSELGADDWLEDDGVICPHCLTHDDRAFADTAIDQQIKEIEEFEAQEED